VIEIGTIARRGQGAEAKSAPPEGTKSPCFQGSGELLEQAGKKCAHHPLRPVSVFLDPHG
jgi:hypothetical protein